MSWNISHFVDTLPLNFDSWNVSSRLDYYADKLYGFGALNVTEQTFIAESFTRKDIIDLWEFRSNPDQIGEGGLNATLEYLKYVVDTYIHPTTTIPTTVAPSPCDEIEEFEIRFSFMMAIPAAILVALFTLFKRRKILCLDCCSGRPGVQYPVNLIDENQRRWAFMAAFGVIAYRILSIFEGNFFWRPDIYDDPDFTKIWGWTKVLLTLLNVIILGIIYYPLYVCITQRKYIIMNIIGIGFVVPWIYQIVHIYVGCSPTEEHDRQLFAVLQLVFDVPIFVAYLLLLVAYFLDLGVNLIALFRRWKAKNYAKFIKQEEKTEFFESHPIQYLEALFDRVPKEPPVNFFRKIKQKFTYEKTEGFRYSLRILCTMVLAFLFLYKVNAFVLFVGKLLHVYGQALLDEAHPTLEEVFANLTVAIKYADEAVEILWWSYLACFLISFILHVAFLFLMLLNYKQHMKKLLRGHKRWHFRNEISPAQQMVYGMRYSGYQIAYMLYGYGILALVLWIIVILLTYLIVIPLRDGLYSPLIDQFKKLWPSIVFGLVILYAQILMAKFCFLQDRGAYMALNNRRVYHIVSFYLFFFNVVLGLFSCLRRILMSLIFGTMLVSRLDRCLLMRGFERFDAGYKAYLGMLEVELYHTHPLLKAFIMILQEQVRDTKLRSTSTDGHVNIGFANGALKELAVTPSKTYDKRIVIKWWKMVTLVHNPSLILERIERKIKEAEKNTKSAIVDGIIETVTTVGAGFMAATGLAVVDGVGAGDNIITAL